MMNHSFKMLLFLNVGVLLLLILLQVHKSMAQTPSRSDMYYKTGETVTFNCTLQNGDDTGAAWKYYSDDNDDRADIIVTRDNPPSNPQHDGRFSAVIKSHPNTLNITYTLTITDLQRNDKGRYLCSGMSEVSEYQLYVFTDRYPRCTIRDNMGNRSVILTCESGLECNYPEIRWFRDGSDSELNSSTQGNTLRTQITISEEDEDVRFTCVVGIGNVTSLPSCSVMPSVSKPNISSSTARAIIGGSVIFTCTGSARDGNISIQWDNNTLHQFQGRYNTSNSELRIRNLKPTDNETNVVCIVRADTVNTVSQSVATVKLLINEYPKTNRTDRSTTTDTMTSTGITESSSNGLGVGHIVASLSALLLVLLVTFLIYAFKKRYRFYQLELSGQVDNLCYVSVGSTKLGGDIVGGSVTLRRKEDQENATGSHDFIQRNGDINISTPPSDLAASSYHEMIDNPMYHVLEQTDEENLSVYAEVQYSESKLKTTDHKGISGDSATVDEHELREGDNTEYKKTAEETYSAQENKKAMRKCEISEDRYADLHHNYTEYRDIADITNTTVENGRNQSSTPRYSTVVKNKSTGQQYVFEEIYAEPNTPSQHQDHNVNVVIRSENFAQSVKEVAGNKEYSDMYAEPLFDEANTNTREGLAGGNHEGMESEYSSLELTNDGYNLEGYSGPEINLPAPVETLPDSQYSASSIYAEIQANGDECNAPVQGDVLEPNNTENQNILT